MEQRTGPDVSPYRVFSRADWANLRQDTPMTLEPSEVSRLHSMHDRLDISEVEEIYLPLSRLLSLYVAATQSLFRAQQGFLGTEDAKMPYIIGVGGSVAVGKSTTARVLQALLARWPNTPKVDLVTTDGFLLPNAVLEREGARWLHTGGIFCALSSTTPDVAIEAMQSAKRHGVIVSYDLNYRASLWKSLGGKKQAQEVNRRVAPHVDVMLGNEEAFSAALGYEVPGLDEHLSAFEVDSFKQMIAKVVKAYPFQVVATTLRKAKTATLNDWGAVCYYDGKFYQAKNRENLEIFDRVGGGDSFASGLIYGLLAGQDPQWSVECGAAHGALAMTTPGDTSMVTLQEVVQVMKGIGARIAR